MKATTPALEVDIGADDIAFYEANGYLAVERVTTVEEFEWLRVIYSVAAAR